MESVWLEYFGSKTLVHKGDDKQGGTWLYEHDPYNALVEIIDPYGGKTLFLYDERGRLEKGIDPEGIQYTYVYGPYDTVIGKRAPGGRFISSKEGGDGRPVHWVGGSALQWELGHLVDAPEAALGEEVARTFDENARGALVVEQDTDKMTHRIHRDPQGLRLSETLVGGSARRFWYDENGNLRRTEDADGQQRTRSYASWNLRTHDESAAGSVNGYSYDHASSLTEWKDAVGNQSRYGYDQKSRLSEIERMGGVKDRFKYDLADRLIEKHDGHANALLTQGYGPDGLLATRALHAVGGDDQTADTQTFTHNTDGRLVEASCNEGAQAFSYHNGVRVADKRDGLGTEHRVYGTQLFKTVVLDKFVTCYRHKKPGHIEITDPTGKTHTVEVLCPGVVQKTYQSGLTELRQYSPYGEVLVRQVDQKGTANDRTTHYGYSNEGDLLSVTEQSRRGNIKTRYQYDAAHRLIEQTLPGGETATFDHDRVGNVQQTAGAAYSYRQGNLLTQKAPLTKTGPSLIGQSHFDYDDRHRLSERRGPEGVHRYRYNALEQLVAVEQCAGADPATGAATDTDPPPHTRVRFYYDVLGRRTRKVIERLHQTGDVQKTHAVTFYYDTDRLSAEVHRDASDQTTFTRVYVYPDRDAIVPMLFIDYEGEDPAPQDGQVYCVVSNHQGAVEQISDADGNIVWQGRYRAYGEVTVPPAHQDFHQPLRWLGHYHDQQTGLHQNRFRDYAPDLCRYLQPDPLGLSGGDNLYRYTHGNPLSRVDVRGLDDCSEGYEGTSSGDGHPGEGPPVTELSELPPDEQQRFREEHAHKGYTDEEMADAYRTEQLLPGIREKYKDEFVDDPNAHFDVQLTDKNRFHSKYPQDYSDVEVVRAGRIRRTEYLEKNKIVRDGLAARIAEHRENGGEMKELADQMVNERNAHRLQTYVDAGDLDGLEKVKQSNLEKYQREEGPTLQWVYDDMASKHNDDPIKHDAPSWEAIMYKSTKSNEAVDAAFGLLGKIL